MPTLPSPDEPDLIDAICADCSDPCRAIADDDQPRCPACQQSWCGEIVLGGLALLTERARIHERQDAA